MGETLGAWRVVISANFQIFLWQIAWPDANVLRRARLGEL
jgi:hypothetical protein